MLYRIENLDDLFSVTYSELLNKYGSIMVHFNNVPMAYTGRDIIGNSLQEWLPNWFEFIGVDIRSNPRTQTFPDFRIHLHSEVYDFEIKCWNNNSTPGFDIANFNSFVSTLPNDPSQLNAYYFLLGYRPLVEGVDFEKGFKVEEIYMKRIWELCGPTPTYPTPIQRKQGQPYALRPANFPNSRANIFESRAEFVYAIAELIDSYPNPVWSFNGREWYDLVKESFEEKYGEQL